MKIYFNFPADFYKKLYNEIMSYGFEPEHEDDDTCEMELEFQNFWVSLTATFDIGYVDDSFDHEFGVEEGGHYEPEELRDIADVTVYVNDGVNDVEVTNYFSYDTFWNQFKVYGIKSRGVQIHYGDEVVVKYSQSWGVWKKMIYLYTDRRLGVHVCCSRLGGYSSKEHFKCILPATTE